MGSSRNRPAIYRGGAECVSNHPLSSSFPQFKPTKSNSHSKGTVCAAICFAALLTVLSFSAGLRAQSPASAVLTQALAASSGGAALTDVTIQAQATWVAGSDHETGAVTLEATSRRESLVTLNLTNGTRQWVRGFRSAGSLPATAPAGAWTGADGHSHAIALHNCWTPAAWFFPALSLSASTSDPQTAIADLGAATKLGGATEHLQLSRILPGQAAKITTEIEQLSTADLYLDSTSLLPVALDFNLHPDNNAARNIPVEIQFSDYRSVAGIRAPFRIQEYLQGSLLLDLTVTSIQVNTGLADSAFAVPANLSVGGGGQ